MTTPVAVSIQATATNTVTLVAEQGSLGLMFRNVLSVNDQAVSNTNPLPVAQTPVAVSGIYRPATATSEDSIILHGGIATDFLEIVNLSTTDTVWLAFDEPAVVGAGGTISLPPGWSKSWETTVIPAEDIHAISSNNTTPTAITIGVH